MSPSGTRRTPYRCHEGEHAQEEGRGTGPENNDSVIARKRAMTKKGSRRAPKKHTSGVSNKVRTIAWQIVAYTSVPKTLSRIYEIVLRQHRSKMSASFVRLAMYVRLCTTYQHSQQDFFGTRAWDGRINDLEYRLVRVGGLFGSKALTIRHYWVVPG